MSQATLRAGARTLSALATPLNVEILRALADGPRSAPELLESLGDPPRTTAHKRLHELVDLGALGQHRGSEFPRKTIYELTPGGERMLELEPAVARWLTEAPTGSIFLGSLVAKRVIATLVAGWSASIIVALADRPTSLTELDRLVDSVSYPSLERRLVALRDIGLVKIAKAKMRGTPYEATDWLRRAVAPLLTAAALEERRASNSAALEATEMRAVLLLTMPLVRLSPQSHGRLAVVVHPEATRTDVPERRAPVGATLEIRDGRVAGCVPEIDENAPNWALGTPTYWTESVLSGIIDRLRIGGRNPQLGADLTAALHQALSKFNIAPRDAPIAQ